MSDAIVKHIPHSVDLNEPVKKTYIDTLLATEDNLAHCFDVTLLKGAEAVAMPSGVAVTAYFIRYSDNATVPIKNGSISGNVASVTLTKTCYNKPGQFAIIIKVTVDSIINTVFYGEGTIYASSTDTVVDEENVIPSLSDLLAQIAVMESATAEAKTATTNAKSATTKANTATTNANNATANANNAAAKIDGMTVSAESSETAGATISEVDGVKHIAFALPKGDKGDKGDPGTIENVTITSVAGLEEALAGKLGTNETAANANQLNGKSADQYALKTDLPTKASDIGALPSDGTAANAEKLNGNSAEFYAARALISDAYDASKIYNSGDYCIIENTLYKCLQDNVTGIAPTNTTYWEAASVSGEIEAVNKRLEFKRLYITSLDGVSDEGDHNCYYFNGLAIVLIRFNIEGTIPAHTIFATSSVDPVLAYVESVASDGDTGTHNVYLYQNQGFKCREQLNPGDVVIVNMVFTYDTSAY